MKSNPKLVEVGSVWESKNYGSFEVIYHGGYLDVTVRFLATGFETKVRASNIRSGEVKDKLLPSVYGVGFFGVGGYIGNSKHYQAWHSMMQRAYSSKFHDKQNTYRGVTVCDEWHNFQVFAKWFEENYPNDGSSYDIDKDLKIIGNKVYSTETCMFVSRVVNGFATDHGSARGDCLIGVYFCKSRRKFQSYCNDPSSGGRVFLGWFSDETLAHLAWRKRKSEFAYELAMIQDREEVKQALLNWKDALDSNKIHPY